MIIVSQDKETIINFENITRISIMPPVEEGYKYSIAINSCLDLGYYKTEERAKEVLDEIVNTRAITEIYKCSNDDTQDIFDRKMLEENLIFDTYEMPKE